MEVLDLIKSNQKICAMIAPAFVATFAPKDLIPKLRALGFDKIFEVSAGAEVTLHNYAEYISNHPEQEKFISSSCPGCVNLIKQRFPDLEKYLIPHVSPMIDTARLIRKDFPEYKTVFIGPCPLKKIEAQNSGEVDASLTFLELKSIFEKEKITALGSENFDELYADEARIFPLSGALVELIKDKDILTEDQMIECDGVINLIQLFSVDSDKKFFDVLMCEHGCINGPGVASDLPIKERIKKVREFRHCFHK